MALVFAAVPAFGEDARDDEAATKQRARKLADEFQVERRSGDEWIAAERVADPVLSFGDATRNNSNGSVWLWGNKGRPAAVMEVYRMTDKPDDWLFVVNNTSAATIQSTHRNSQWWQPNESDLEMKRIPQNIEVQEGRPGRLLQMKALARRFEAHEFWNPNNSRFELRLLAQPLYRYSDENAGLVDGALFAHANGTNPEVLMFIEAHRGDDGAAEWQYGLARLGHAEMHVAFDKEEVWTAPRHEQLAANEPYWMLYETIPDTEATTP
jgi:hypothetical protein